MSYTIHNTTDWSFKQLNVYAHDLTVAMTKMTARFRDELTLKDMAYDIATGHHQLWLILDHEAQFKAFLTTEISLTKTAKKRVTLCQLAGTGGLQLAAMLNVIENWAKTIGAHEICPIGRLGWRKMLDNSGYKPVIIKYRKEL